jgi:uncharacterized membrane protein
LVIHFPIGLLVAAVAIDVVDALFKRPAWLGAAATSLYVVGAATTILAYFTGVQAGSTVFVPGMAHPLIDDHGRWAVVTVWFFAAVAVLRVAVWRVGVPRRRLYRALLLITGLTGILLLQQTAERGARLVYEHGVGVIAAPQSP